MFNSSPRSENGSTQPIPRDDQAAATRLLGDAAGLAPLRRSRQRRQTPYLDRLGLRSDLYAVQRRVVALGDHLGELGRHAEAAVCRSIRDDLLNIRDQLP